MPQGAVSFHGAPQTFVGSGPAWALGHSGSSLEDGHLFGFSSLLGPVPIWLGRTGIDIGSTLHCPSPALFGSPVAWLKEKSPVTPWLGHDWGDAGYWGWGKNMERVYAAMENW
jgi:hypothetical protein